MAGQDPFTWSVDQVIDQICSITSSLRASLTIKPNLDLQKLKGSLQDNDIDGESLLSLEDVHVKDDLGISSFGQRREMRKIIQYLRSTSELYKTSLDPPSKDLSKRSFSERESSSEPQPEIQAKKRRIQPLNLSTEPLTQPDQFDLNDLSDEWKDFLDRHQEELDEEVLRPYNESDVEKELDSDADQSLINELESDDSQTALPTPRLTMDEINHAIDEAIQEYKDNWTNSKRYKKYEQAQRRWLQAAKAGTRKPQQHALQRELEHIDARLSKFRKAITDISNDYQKIEEVKRNCANLQATVEDGAEKEYYLEVLSSNEPPEKPATDAKINAFTHEQLPDGEELLESTDSELYTFDNEDTDESNEVDFVSEDDSGLSLPYDPADHDWNPQIPTVRREPRQMPNIMPDPFVDAPCRHSTPGSKQSVPSPPQVSNTWPPLPPPPMMPDMGVQNTPLIPPEPIVSHSTHQLELTSPTVISSRAEPPASNSVQFELNDETDLDELPTLPRSRYRDQGATVATAITLGSSPPGSATDDTVSDQSVKTPPLNPTTPSRVKLEKTVVVEKWPEIQSTRALKWTDIDDERTALCKVVYRFARQNAVDVLEYIRHLTILEMPSTLHAMIAEVQDQKQDEESHDDDDDVDSALLWLYFFVTFICKRGFRSIWRVPESFLDEAYNAAATRVSQFDRLLKPLLQHYISTKTDTPNANASGRYWNQQYKQSGVLGLKDISSAFRPTEDGRPTASPRTAGTGIRPRVSKASSFPDTDTEAEAEVEGTSSIRKRKRAVQQSQEALMQQAADQSRVQEQEYRREMLMSKLQSQDITIDERKVPINTDPDNVVFLDQHIARRIKDHQITGIQFIWRELVEDSKHQGALLAHTMGLGKTMQVISFLVTLAQCNASHDPQIRSLIPQNMRSGKTLILCPASLVDNWYDEILMWTPPLQMNLLGNVYKGLGTRNAKLRNIELKAGPTCMD